MANTTADNWDAGAPANDAFLSEYPLETRVLRAGVKARLDKEHIALAASGAGGEHLEGSARAYTAAADPTKKPDTTTNLDSNDDGRLAVRTDIGGALRYHNGTVWGYVRTADSFAIYQETQSNSTPGGTFTSGSWQQRVMNNEASDLDAIGAISGGDISLAAGTYLIEAWAVGYKCGTHRLQLYNQTDASVIATGIAVRSPASEASATPAHVVAIVTIAATKSIRLRHQCETTRSTDGLGQNASFSVTEVYAEVLIKRVYR